jgi:hypothetical protein
MLRILFALSCLIGSLAPTAASAWGYQGHRVVGSIADKLLSDNAKAQVKQILNPQGLPEPPPGTHDFDLRKAGPWADCVRSVDKLPGDIFKYSTKDMHPEYELPCIPFRNERSLMEDYAARNWDKCTYSSGCQTTYHFDDVALQRSRFDRTFRGTNEHDLVAAVSAAIAVLTDKPLPPSSTFSIVGKREALLLLTHFVGDLHQPLHVAAAYLDTNGKLVDPDAVATVDPASETAGGNAIQDQNINLHTEWDDIPTDIGDAATRELLAAARAVPATQGPMQDWPVTWATDSILVAHDAFAGLSFKFNTPQPGDIRPPQWFVAFDDHTAYLWLMDQIKRRQLAKGGARLAQILNSIWP